MSTVNRVILLGHLGKDPVLKVTSKGPVCEMSVATSEEWKSKDGADKLHKKSTEWHTVIVWGKTAEACNKYLTKGSSAFIEGTLKTRSWDGDDGQRKYKTEVLANNVQFIGKKDGSKKNTALVANVDEDKKEDYTLSVDPDYTADDIPF